MALIDVVLEQVSVKSALLAIPTLFLGWFFLRLLQAGWDNFRISRGGYRARHVHSALPFGLSLLFKTLKMSKAYKNLEMWRQIFPSPDRTGATAETRLMGRRILFTIDPENIKAILATQFGDFGKGAPFHREWKDFLGDSIFTTDGALWHGSRQLIRPQFIKDRVSDLHTFEKHMHDLFRTIANGGALDGEHQFVNMEAGNGRRVDIADLFFRFTLDTATDFLLGQDVKSLSTPRQEFAEAFQEVQKVQSIIARAGPLNTFVDRRSFRAGMKIIDAFIDRYIDLALQLSPEELSTKVKGNEGYTFLHELASFTRDRKVLHDQLIAVLLAGRDTTACTLSWTIYELGRNPEAVKKLRAEILSVVGPNRPPTYDDLKSMKYLQNVMNETLRLYPVVPFNVRLALKDTTLPRGGGPDGTEPVFVLKDTPIAYSTLTMQRRADMYPPTSDKFADSQVFSPERWFTWQPKPWHYIPFNGGPRICIGQQFALTEMGYVLTRLFQRFERVESYMDQIDGGSPTLRSEIVLQPGDGVHVAFFEPAK